MNHVRSLLVEAEVQQSSNELSFGPCPRCHHSQPSHYPPKGVGKMGDICCSIAILRNKIGISVLILDNPKKTPVLLISFTLAC